MSRAAVKSRHEKPQADKVTRRCFGGRLTADDRRYLHEKYPLFYTLTSDDLLAASRSGLRGEAAVEYALRARGLHR